ncbi:molybdopterin-guanine dinucleotide biosynthesis protein B [Tistrella mobilis]|uniref:molybdopterin-guanine dinucleotide biosynthesis protein B n=1 Tax=Tistrella mobilis TaxID=171437 RepID=UPI00355911F1
MRIIGLVGPGNSGKTTLIEGLIPLLAAGGRRVVTVKRSHHRPDLDRPGKDSDRHRRAGAAAVVVGGGGLVGVLREEPATAPDGVSEPDPVDQLRRWLTLAGPADIAIVEGFAGAGHPRLEVLAPGRRDARWPLYPRDDRILGIVVPDPAALTCAALDRDMLGGRPIFGRDDLHAVAGFVMSEAWPRWS